MTSLAHRCLQILQIVIRNIWTVLFFLSSLSVLSLANHFWDRIVSAFLSAQAMILNGFDYLRAL